MNKHLPAVGLVCLAALAILGLARCGFTRPAVNDSDYAKPKFDHTNFAASCAPCHESERPKPVNVTPHGNGQDCASCHRFTSDAAWASLQQFSHVPAPTSCLSCHGSLRPPPPGHVDQTNDCVQCHAFPSFTKLKS